MIYVCFVHTATVTLNLRAMGTEEDDSNLAVLSEYELGMNDPEV